jgi:hypothetical protein
VGVPFDGKKREGVVYRLKKAPQSLPEYPYLIVSDNIGEPADVLAIKDFRRVKERLKKKTRKGIGIEVMIAPVRKMDAIDAGKWFDDIRDVYSFCHSSGCQLILSSGASLIHEMVSGPSFDAVLKNCDIDPQKHWGEMNGWLESRLFRRVTL